MAGSSFGPAIILLPRNMRLQRCILVPGTRIELVQGHALRDFKSLASTYSATQAWF